MFGELRSSPARARALHGHGERRRTALLQRFDGPLAVAKVAVLAELALAIPTRHLDLHADDVGQHLVRSGYVAHPSSYFLWLPMIDDARVDVVARELVQHRIAVSTAEPYATTQQAPHALRIALGSVDLETLRRSLRTVSAVVGGAV
jgi:hypothetical protein